MSLKYVASRLGISAATVSNVLNGKGRVSKDLEEKIRQFIRAENIDIKRRCKKRNNTTKRYIVLAATENRFILDNIVLHERLLTGITSVIEPYGYSLLLPSMAITPRNIRDVTRDADALLLIGLDTGFDQYSTAVPCPVIWLFRTHCDSADIVHEDHKEIGKLAAQHLFDHGHHIVGFIDDPRVESLTEKGLFFTHYMNSLGGKVITVAGKVFKENKDESDDLNEHNLRVVLGKLMAKRNNVTALFVPGNRLYADVSLTIWKIGRRNENAVEILPCVSNPPVSSSIQGYIDIRLEEIGRCAAQCVLWRLGNPNSEPIRIVVRPKLVPGLIMA